GRILHAAGAHDRGDARSMHARCALDDHAQPAGTAHIPQVEGERLDARVTAEGAPAPAGERDEERRHGHDATPPAKGAVTRLRHAAMISQEADVQGTARGPATGQRASSAAPASAQAAPSVNTVA